MDVGGGAAGASTSQGGGGGDSAGAGGAPAEARRICDGSSNLRFAAAMPWNGPVQEGMGLLYELGVKYIFVTGQCEYVTWNKDSTVTLYGGWSAARRGVLSAQLEQQLNDDFDYSSWPQKPGNFGPDSRIADAPSLLLFDGTTRLACHKPCDVSAPKFNQALEGLSDWTKRLYDSGADVMGPMRFRAFEVDRHRGVELLAWPLGASPESVLSEQVTRIHGPATLLTDSTDLSVLRAARANLAARTISSAAYAEHADSSLSYAFAFRDVLPFEDADGKVPGFDLGN